MGSLPMAPPEPAAWAQVPVCQGFVSAQIACWLLDGDLMGRHAGHGGESTNLLIGRYLDRLRVLDGYLIDGRAAR